MFTLWHVHAEVPYNKGKELKSRKFHCVLRRLIYDKSYTK